MFSLEVQLFSFHNALSGLHFPPLLDKVAIVSKGSSEIGHTQGRTMFLNLGKTRSQLGLNFPPKQSFSALKGCQI